MSKVDTRAVRTARRLCAARIRAAGRALTASPSDEAVHLARRELKRARALLRLVRSGLAGDAYGRVNGTLREIGQMLGGARDAVVLKELARETAAGAGIAPAALRSLLMRFERERRTRQAHIDAARARAQLKVARQRLLAAPLEGDGTMLAVGFVRIYRRGRRALEAAREVPRPTRLHEWRKHVKQYWHALEVLEPAWPRVMTALAGEAHRLADVLGAYHDCTLLAARLDAAPLAPALRRKLAAALVRRRALLRSRAFTIGARLYEERPRRLAPRAAQWWQHWVVAAPTAARRGRARRA